MKVFLDDLRAAPEGWKLVRWPNEAIELLKTGEVTEISLDHDLGDDVRGTGSDVILWMEQAIVDRYFPPIMKIPLIKVHSANTSARLKMEAGIASIYRLAHTGHINTYG